MFNDFPKGLHHRKGHKNLVGIDVYYDFVWKEVIPSRMTQFRGGKSLARLVQKDCPAGKTPALLLTIRDEEAERGFETDSHYVLPVRIREYLQQKGAEQAATYFAKNVAVTRPEIQRALENDPELKRDTIQNNLDIEEIKNWAAVDLERLQLLRQITEASSPTEQPSSISLEEIASVIGTMGAIDAKFLSAVKELFTRVQDPQAQFDLLETLTKEGAGRLAVAKISAVRLPDRISDARKTAAEYRQLLNDPITTETDLQKFLEGHPWLLGLDYTRVHSRKNVIRGQADFILERYDGHLDILELKGPDDPIVSAPDVDNENVPPSPTKYCIGPAVSNALAQIHVYRDSFDSDESTLERVYGLKHTRNPRLIVVVGKASALPEHRKRVLEQLNRSLHRVEIVPYDVIADRAEANLVNLERLMNIVRDAHVPDVTEDSG